MTEGVSLNRFHQTDTQSSEKAPLMIPLLPSITELRTGLRISASMAGRILPEQRNIAIERWLRGYEEAEKLKRANAALVSFGKSGRTWLRVMLSRYFARLHGFPSPALMEFDEFRRRHPAIPAILFTHDNYLRDYTGTDDKLANYGRSRIILLLRDPRDTAVSQYFQWKHRIRRRKKIINAYPLGDLDLHDFITGEAAGIPKVITFMNGWAKDIERFPDLVQVHYERLKADTPGEFARVLSFLGQSPSEADITDAVAYASIENMRQMEAENARKPGFNTRLRPGDSQDPASFKVRRAKVGGWRDYVTEDEAEAIDDLVRERLSPIFGYHESPARTAGLSLRRAKRGEEEPPSSTWPFRGSGT